VGGKEYPKNHQQQEAKEDHIFMNWPRLFAFIYFELGITRMLHVP
jgi:hypothetical protein